MDRSSFDALRDDLYKKICDISARKGADYSGDDDALSSFKKNGERLGMTPLQVWGVLAEKHWDALETFIRTGKLESEGIENRITDIILYMFLLHGLVTESSSGGQITKKTMKEVA